MYLNRRVFVMVIFLKVLTEQRQTCRLSAPKCVRNKLVIQCQNSISNMCMMIKRRQLIHDVALVTAEASKYFTEVGYRIKKDIYSQFVS